VYDGTPVIAEAFALIIINGGTGVTTMKFASDLANDAHLEDLQIPGVDLNFDPDIFAYTANVSGADTFSVYPTPVGDNAKVVIKVGNKKYTEGAPIPIGEANTVVNIVVTNGAATLTYTVTVGKGR
jgi:hypothetical protein